MDFLQSLNEAQLQATTHEKGPAMVIAGAGSGKTRVLTFRLAFLIDQGLADPFDLLALTFTNKAAREMKERIMKLVGTEAKNIWMGTFHSVFARILRREAEKIGYTSAFTIYDTEDSTNILKQIITSLNLDDKKFKPKVLRNHISSAKNALVDPDEYAANFVTDTFTNQIARVYKIYNSRLFDANSMDFDDLLIKPIELFDRYADVKYKYQNRFRYLMVDEYQDTNEAQYTLLKQLAAVHENIVVVGDDAQSIYSFRGANIQNILNFQKDYPDAKVFKLEQNYRSTQNIVNAANSIIAKNKNQIPKEVYTQNDTGDLLKAVETDSEQEESRFVADQVREQTMRFGYNLKDFAVLYRTNMQSRAMEAELRRQNIRYKVFGGVSFYQRKEIKDVIAYLKLAINPKDEAALNRVINYPARGIGKGSTTKISVFADENGCTPWEVLERINEFKLQSRIRKAIENFVFQIKNYAIVAKEKDAYEAASYIAKESGILKDLFDPENPEIRSRWENVQELLNSAKEFAENPDNDAHTLDAFLADISLFTDQDQVDENPDYVTLMTIHSAKGLEFRSLFLVGLEEELFPSFMSMESRADLEEERRLFYVAVTRAKERLALTYAKTRYRYGNIQYNEPSRFLQEIDDKFLSWASMQRQRSADAGDGRVMGSGRRIPPPVPGRIRRRPAASKSDFQGDDLSGLTAGMEVEHQRFGPGKVIQLEGEGSEKKATVHFKDKGRKVLLLKYAKLKILT